MAKSFAKVLNTKSSNRSPEWKDQDKEAVKTAVNNIIQGGDGGMEDYNPDLIGKVSQSLAFVNTKAHGGATDVEYESMPIDLKEDLSYTANNKLNINGSMTRDNLKEEAKSWGVKLSEKELDDLENNPGRQTPYIWIKGASSSIDTKTMTASIATMLNDVRNKTISNKAQLKTRLQNILEVDNPDHLNYLVDDLWADLNKNRSTTEQVSRIKEQYGELFGFEDRTTAQKWKTAGLGYLDNLYRETTNGISWIVRNTPEALAVSMAGVPGALVLWGLNSKDVDKDTGDMVDSVREILLGRGMWNALNNMADEAGDWLKKGGDAGIAFAMDENADRGKRALENSKEGRTGEFLGGLTAEMAFTEMAGGAIADIWGGLGAVKQLKGWDKLLYTVVKSGTEGGAFSITNNAGEDMGVDMLFMEALGLFGMGMSAVADTAPVKTFMAKTLVGGRKVWNKMIQTAREGGDKRFKNAKKKVTDLILNTIPKGSHTAEEIGKSMTKELDLLSKDKTRLLGFVEGTYESKYAQKVLKEVFGGTEKEMEAYWGRYYSKLEGKGGRTIEELEAEWEALKKLYQDGNKEFTASELERIRSMGDSVMPRFNDSKGVLLNGAEANTFNSYLEPLKQEIQDIYKKHVSNVNKKLGGVRGMIKDSSKEAVDSTKKELSDLGKEVLGDDLVEEAFGDLHDIDLQMSILTDARNGVESKIGETWWQRFSSKGLSTLIGGGLVAGADWLTDGDVKPSPYLVAIGLLATYATVSDPKAISAFASVFSRMSEVELASFFKALDEGTFVTTSEKLELPELVHSMEKVLYTDTAKYLKDKLSGDKLEKKPMPRYVKK